MISILHSNCHLFCYDTFCGEKSGEYIVGKVVKSG